MWCAIVTLHPHSPVYICASACYNLVQHNIAEIEVFVDILLHYFDNSSSIALTCHSHRIIDSVIFSTLLLSGDNRIHVYSVVHLTRAVPVSIIVDMCGWWKT